MGHPNRTQELIGELIGTFILVFVGTASVITAKLAAGQFSFGVLEYLGVGTAFGVALMVAAYTVGPVSGAHLNPAVTLGLALDKRLPWDRVLPYIVAQCVGAILASLALFTLLGTKAHGLGETMVGSFGSRGALGAEVSLTALLVLLVLGVTDKRGPAGLGGLIIGIYLAASHLVGIPFSGNSLNPARSLGPAVLMGGPALQQLVPVYVVAPLIGGVVGAFVYRWLKK
ncbi:MAG: aquaporin family protein [Candidatus Omnitrophica bacterium]|nr:aquaporin family protein [Candidatus Omnitrophota bacterium]